MTPFPMCPRWAVGGTARTTFVGSVKWRDDAPFGVRDLAELGEHARHVRGAESAELVVVTRTPPTEGAREDPAACWQPDGLLEAWA